MHHFRYMFFEKSCMDFIQELTGCILAVTSITQNTFFLIIKYTCFTECVLIYFAANGTYQANENNERVPKAVSTNGYDGMQTSPKLSRMISGNYTCFCLLLF